jgi:hypothetical protein
MGLRTPFEVPPLRIIEKAYDFHPYQVSKIVKLAPSRSCPLDSGTARILLQAPASIEAAIDSPLEESYHSALKVYTEVFQI